MIKCSKQKVLFPYLCFVGFSLSNVPASSTKNFRYVATLLSPYHEFSFVDCYASLQ
jgi:hypothetical protein